MNKYLLTIILALFILSGFSQSLNRKLEKLAAQHNFTFESVGVDSLFKEKYLLIFEQPLDHDDPGGQKFRQLVILSHLDKDSPVVFVTEGYAAGYALSEKYVNELSYFLQANQVVVEHRYFGSSTPDTINWEQLTVANAAADHHAVVQVLKEIYQGKWVNTGISKGGQTTMYHRYFYPEDVDASVPYVAPLNFASEDERVYYFLDTVSSADCRNRILEFQKELIRNKEKYIPVFQKMSSRRNLTYRMGIEKAFELTVLEYSFAFFQWGLFDCMEIPSADENPEALVQHLDQVSGLSWISNEGIAGLQPFFYQAMREIGFYGYDITPFSEWISYRSNPTFQFSVPEGIHVDFDGGTMAKVDAFIRHEAENMLFIYGGADPWSSTAVDLTRNTNSIKVVKKGGSHSTRIGNLPDEQKELVLKTLKDWLQEE